MKLGRAFRTMWDRQLHCPGCRYHWQAGTVNAQDIHPLAMETVRKSARKVEPTHIETIGSGEPSGSSCRCKPCQPFCEILYEKGALGGSHG